MANTDIQPPTSLYAVLSYIGKYVSKPEKSSLSYTELQSQVLPYINDRAPLLSFVSKMLNKLIGERDWSAQEVSHILLQLPVQKSSRMLVSLDCRPDLGSRIAVRSLAWSRGRFLLTISDFPFWVSDWLSASNLRFCPELDIGML